MIARNDVGIGGILRANGVDGGGIIKASGDNPPNLAHDVKVRNGAFLFAESTGSGPGGDISFQALRDVIINGGLRASGTDGGEITAHGGRDVIIGTTADMLARGSNIGGKMVLTAGRNATVNGLSQVDGAFGGGSFKANGQNVSAGALTNANAGIAGKGGIVSLLGTVKTFFSGIITARGGASSGDGGKVIIATPNTITGIVDVSAPNGANGTYIH
jgi:hypothetical protein